MKLKLSLFALISIIGFSGCEKVKEALQVPIKIETPVEGVSLEIPAIPKQAEGKTINKTYTLTFDVDIIKELKRQSASIENVKRVELVSFVIEEQSSTPEDANLTLIQAMEVYAKSDSFEEKKIATLINSNDSSKLVFEIEQSLDLLGYLKDKGTKEMVLKNIKIGKNPTKTNFVLTVKPKWKFVFGL